MQNYVLDSGADRKMSLSKSVKKKVQNIGS